MNRLRRVIVVLTACLAGVAHAQAQETVIYYHTDAIGSVRMITDENGQVIARYDYLPFGEPWSPPPPQNQDVRQFAGKERDPETGFDYFGARYYASGTGRFTTVDPLGSSAKLTNPQTFNRYAYALNNPVRFIDPDGLEVPESCLKEPTCKITVKVNVIYDSGSRLSSEQREKFQREQLNRAKEMYGTSNIQLDFTYTEGSFSINNGKVFVTGLNSNALNLFVTNKFDARSTRDDNTAVSFVNPAQAHTMLIPLAAMHTTGHELGHQFLGDVFSQRNFFVNLGRDAVVDSRLLLQGLGFGQNAFRVGLGPRVYAAPLTAVISVPKP